MTEILLLRHSMTRGNLEGRYVGCRTDESLCEEGIRLLQSRSYPAVDRIYASPMKRCVETAQVIWGTDAQMTLVPELRECDFGAFENQNYKELSGNSAYQAWIDSGGTLPFPDGGTIMAVLERFGFPKKAYFDYQVKNGCGYMLTPVEGTDLWNYQCLPWG